MNLNIGCIETQILIEDVDGRATMNLNIGCIETKLLKDVKKN